jgi:hypothetical protein
VLRNKFNNSVLTERLGSLKPVCILKVRERGVKDKLYWRAGMKNLENTEVEKESCRFINTTT